MVHALLLLQRTRLVMCTYFAIKILRKCSFIIRLVFIYNYRIIPESPRWLISKSRKKEALKIIRKAATVNRRQAPDDISSITDVTEAAQHGSMLHVFKSPVLLGRWLILCFNW